MLYWSRIPLRVQLHVHVPGETCQISVHASMSVSGSAFEWAEGIILGNHRTDLWLCQVELELKSDKDANDDYDVTANYYDKHACIDNVNDNE